MRLVPAALAAALALVLPTAGCFDPDYPTNLPCGPDRFCPSGQTCSADDICVADDGPPQVDASPPADASPPPDAGLGELLSIGIGADLMLPLGQTYTFVVTATYEHGSAIADNAFVIWSSSDNAIAYIDFMGVAHPQVEGTATITADFEGRVDTAEITVTPAM